MLPVWLLLAPRDYLSAFIKIGTVALLAAGLLWVQPEVQLPALTRFVDGTGPVFAGKLFPFCFITIACGAISGFHSLIASGTTPKLLDRESDARFIGYGAMLMESFVAIMALLSAAVMEPGVYFAINSPAAAIGTTLESASAAVTGWGFPLDPAVLDDADRARSASTALLSRTGGAPTLAVGMAEIFSRALGGAALKALWYHFAIMFEALFILTTLDAGTRVGRFMVQDLLGNLWAPLGRTSSLPANVLASGADRRRLGLLPLPGRRRPARRHQLAVAALRHREPAARGDGARLRDHGAGEVRPRALRRADRPARSPGCSR